MYDLYLFILLLLVKAMSLERCWWLQEVSCLQGRAIRNGRVRAEILMINLFIPILFSSFSLLVLGVLPFSIRSYKTSEESVIFCNSEIFVGCVHRYFILKGLERVIRLIILPKRNYVSLPCLFVLCLWRSFDTSIIYPGFSLHYVLLHWNILFMWFIGFI